MVKRISLLLLVFLLCTAAIAGAEETPAAEEKPTVGVVMMLSPTIQSDKDCEAQNMMISAVNAKFSAEKFTIDKGVTPIDFRNFLGKKEMLVYSVPQMISQLKLANFAEYGEAKGLDLLVVVMADVVFNKNTSTSLHVSRDKEGKVTSLYNTKSTYIRKTDLSTRVVVVDVKKKEYTYNVLLSKNLNNDPGFHTEVRATRAVIREYVRDFEQQIKI